jgi:predicted transcriptional regulator
MPHLQQLQSLGLSETEAIVYLEIAEIGKATAQAISKRTAIARTTVYWLLENLAGKGLVTAEKKKDTTFYIANQPQALLRMVQEEKRKALSEITAREEIARELVTSVQPFFKSHRYNLPRLQIFEGKSAVTSLLYDHLPIWQESIAQHDFTWWGYQDPTFPEHYLEWMKASWKIKKEKERYCIVTNQAEIEKKLARAAPHRKMKFLSPQYNFSSTIWVLGEYIVLIMTSQKPHYAFQLRDPIFAGNMRMVFHLLWEAAL